MANHGGGVPGITLRSHSTNGPLVPFRTPIESPNRDGQPVWPWVLGALLCTIVAVLPQEAMNRYDRGCGDLVCLVEFTFGALVGLPAVTKARVIPLKYHLALLVTSLGKSFLQNSALAAGMPMSLYLLLKNGSLVASIAVGVTALGKSYNWQQYLAVLCVTLGIAVATHKPASSPSSEESNASSGAMFGILCLGAALLLKAIGGAVQEKALKSYGCAPEVVNEMIFWQSLLAIPFFLFRWSSVTGHLATWNSIDGVVVAGVSIPLLWSLLLVNVLLDRCCKLVITGLIGKSSSLAASLTLTMSRLISIVISAAFVNSPPPPPVTLWLGCALVVVGTGLYKTAKKTKTA